MRPSPTQGIARERVHRNIAQSIRDVLQKLLGRPVAYCDYHFDDIIRGFGATRASRSAVSGEPVYHFTQHAIAVMAERRSDPAWVLRTLAGPERTEADRDQIGVRHALARVPERDGRWLRVVYNVESRPMRVVSAYFDRGLAEQL